MAAVLQPYAHCRTAQLGNKPTACWHHQAGFISFVQAHSTLRDCCSAHFVQHMLLNDCEASVTVTFAVHINLHPLPSWALSGMQWITACCTSSPATGACRASLHICAQA